MAKMDFLKRRAEDFLATAEYHIKKEKYGLAAFDLEQACQLYLKYYLFLKIRFYPPTHSLKELLSSLEKAYDKKKKETEKLKEKNINLISDLEQSYITSRYLPAEFTKKQIENMKKFTEILTQFLKKL